MTVTIIIPTYNRAPLLQKAIQSVLDQSYKNIQLMILDNASDDTTKALCEKIAKADLRVQYVRHEKNIGMLANYQFGLRAVKTEFFSFLSDDDILLPHYVEVALEGAQQFPSAAFFACSTVIMTTSGKFIREPLALWSKEGFYEQQEGLYEMISQYPVPNTVLFKKSFLTDVTIDFENPLYWDCDFLLQIAARYPIAISKKQCGIFYSHPESFSAKTHFLQNFKASQRLKERLFSIVKDYKNAIDKMNNDFCKHACGLVVQSLINRQLAEANLIIQKLHNEKITSRRFQLLSKMYPLFYYFPLMSVFLKFLRTLKHIKKALCPP